MKQRGFSLEIVLIALMALAVMLGAGWLMHKGAEGERERTNAINTERQAKRTEIISGLALKIADLHTAQTADRLKYEREANELRATRKGRLHEFVSKVAGSDTCIRSGWVRYTNSAAAGVPLDARPGVGVSEEPAGIGTDTVAEIIAGNYDKYHDCKATLARALKDFDAKRSAFNETVKRINSQ